MGVVHKLRPEIIEFIIQQKKGAPGLSCRSLADLLFITFKTRVSKSSVNEIVREAGLSQPVGRRVSKAPPQTLKERIHLALSHEAGGKLSGEDKLAVEAEKKAHKEREERSHREEEEKTRIEQERLKLEQEHLKLEAEKIAEDQKILQEQKNLEDKIRAAGETKKLDDERRLKEEQERIARDAAEKARLQEEILKAEQGKLKAEKERKEKEETAKKIEEEQSAKEQEAAKVPKEVFVYEPPLAVEEKERDCSGLILLKAVDYLLGGSFKFNEIIQKKLGKDGKETVLFNEGLIYSPFLEKNPAGLDSLNGILGQDIPQDKFRDYLLRVQEAGISKPELSSAIIDISKEVRCLKIIFVDGSFLYIDADFYTTWSTQYTPYDFSTGINKVKSDLNRYLLNNHPLVLFMASGYDFPTKEFMGLIINFSLERNIPQTITLYDNKLSEMASIRASLKKTKYQLVFGLWPWQFVGARHVKSIGEFSAHHLKKLGSDFFLADIQLELVHPETKQRAILNGCALKNSLSEQTRLVILTNANKGVFKLDELADMYLCNWPNQEETFQDYSRKVELFTYTADSQKFFSLDMMSQEFENAADIRGILGSYFKLLDLYLKCHFLPTGYEEKEFETMKSRFYDLIAHIKPEENSTKVTFSLPAGYAYARDLEYLCRRLNEKNIEFYPGKTARFSL